MNRALTFTLAAIAAVVTANDNSDDTTGIFGDADQWKSGYV